MFITISFANKQKASRTPRRVVAEKVRSLGNFGVIRYVLLEVMSGYTAVVYLGVGELGR